MDIKKDILVRWSRVVAYGLMWECRGAWNGVWLEQLGDFTEMGETGKWMVGNDRSRHSIWLY